jgi:small-conductance mechanosensitive channel
MDNEMKSLKDLWEKTKPVPPAPVSVAALRQKALANKRSSVIFQYTNIAILFSLAIVIYLFLGIWFPYHTAIGQTGVVLMTGSLLVRVIIEWLSILRSKQIRLDAQVLESTATAMKYYQFRKRIHRPVTFIIVAIYTAGFYMLMPEFTSHAPLWLSLMVMISYPVGAVIIIYQIRKGIKKEMQDLKELAELQDNIVRNRDLT